MFKFFSSLAPPASAAQPEAGETFNVEGKIPRRAAVEIDGVDELDKIYAESGSVEVDNKDNDDGDNNEAMLDVLSIVTEDKAADEAKGKGGGGETKLGSFISGVASKINLVNGTTAAACATPSAAARTAEADGEDEARNDSPLLSPDPLMSATPPRAPPSPPAPRAEEVAPRKEEDGFSLARASSPLCCAFDAFATPVECPDGFEVDGYSALRRLATGGGGGGNGAPSSPATPITEIVEDDEGSPLCCTPASLGLTNGNEDEVTAEGAVIVKAPMWRSEDSAANDSPGEQLKSIVLDNLSKGYQLASKATEDVFFPQLQEPPMSHEEQARLNESIRKAQEEAAALHNVLQRYKGGEKETKKTKEHKGGKKETKQTKELPQEEVKEKAPADEIDILSVQTEKKEPAKASGNEVKQIKPVDKEAAHPKKGQVKADDNEAEQTKPVEKEVLNPKKEQAKVTENNTQQEKPEVDEEGAADAKKVEEEGEKKKKISSMTFRRVKSTQSSGKPPKSPGSVESKEKIPPKAEPMKKTLSFKKSASFKKSIGGGASGGKKTTNGATAPETKELQEAESIKRSPSAASARSDGSFASVGEETHSEEASTEYEESLEAEPSASMISTRSSVSFASSIKKGAGSETKELQEAEPIKKSPSTASARSRSSVAKKTKKKSVEGEDLQEPEAFKKSPSVVSIKKTLSFKRVGSIVGGSKKANNKAPNREDPKSDAADKQGAQGESPPPQNQKPKFDYFQVVIADDDTDMMVRLPSGVDHTFLDLRREIEDDDLLPFSKFKFTVEAGGMGVHKKQEKKWRVSDYALTERGDGSYRRPHRVYIKEGKK